ncbi:unnamed protein product [Leptosia nina]|uniref:FLYWCH-type domain-containing protein n=1 Tax=Leptosia nina TaxID=320188 RepID=A0AAV1J644_9NEOP
MRRKETSNVATDECILSENFVRLCVGPGGRPRLWVRGKSFYAAHTMRSGIVRWRCTMGGCGCKAYTQKGKLHKLMGEHNHENRWKRRPIKANARYSGFASNSYALPRVPQLDFDNFDPTAWVTPY